MHLHLSVTWAAAEDGRFHVITGTDLLFCAGFVSSVSHLQLRSLPLLPVHGNTAIFWQLEIKDLFKNSLLSRGVGMAPRASPGRPLLGSICPVRLRAMQPLCPNEKPLFWPGLSLIPAIVLSWT